MTAGIVAAIALIRPLPRIYLPTRRRASYLLASSFLMFGVGGSMLPESPDSDQIILQNEDKELSEAPQQSTPSIEEQVTQDPEKQPENVELHEIMMKWNSERSAYNDPETFVFTDWKNKPIRVTGLVFQKSTIPNVDGSAQISYVYFHGGGGDKDLVDGIWKWTGYNRGVYAKFNDQLDVETVQPDDFATIICTGVKPMSDKESGVFFGIELENCYLEKASE